MARPTGSRKRLVVLSILVALVCTVDGVRADFVFGTPANLGLTVNSPTHDVSPSISADGLELCFGSFRSGGYGEDDIWVTTRPTIDDEWARPTNLGPQVNSSRYEGGPSLSADGLSLYFSSTRPGGYGHGDIWVTRRATRNDDWGTPVNLGPAVNSSADEYVSAISFDGLQLLFSDRETFRPGGFGDADLWMTTRPTVSDPWEPPVNLGPTLNSPANDRNPCVSADGLVLFLTSARSGGYGRWDIWMARRATAEDDWEAPVNLGPIINSAVWDGGPDISADGRTLYFHSGRVDPVGYGNGIYDLWQVPIEPVVDFTGDGKVDGRDVLTMTDRWGMEDSLCDIGPMPWGDGAVNLQDLTVLAEYIGQEIFDPTLIAHWALDETEGTIAHDRVGDNHGTVTGTCAWEPADGRVDGALAFDGTTCIVADFVLDPGMVPFSVFTWIKGGMPGQVLISQTDGQNWLMADTAEGTLATGLIPPKGRAPIPPLVSDMVITDGSWHRIGLVWDDTSRKLYVDDILVAEDIQEAPVHCWGDMNIGCGKDMASDTFFTGVIDEVRIYSRPVKP